MAAYRRLPSYKKTLYENSEKVCVQRRCSLVSTVKPPALTTISLMATELVKASDFSVGMKKAVC